MRNGGGDEEQAGIKIAWRYSNNLRYADNTILVAESEEDHPHGIRSHHFMANTWGNNGNSDRIYFFGLQNRCRWLLQL